MVIMKHNIYSVTYDKALKIAAQAIILVFLVYAKESLADYSPNQDEEVVGQVLWLYFDEQECRDNLKIFTQNTSSDTYIGNQAVQLKVRDLSRNWVLGDRYYFDFLDENGTKGYAYHRDVSNSRGYTKYLYYEKNQPDLVLLKNACLTNISPTIKAQLIQQENQNRNVIDKLARENSQKEFEEKQRLKEERLKEQLEKQRMLDAEKELDERKINEARALKEKEDYIRQLPEQLRSYSKDEFCIEYGRYLQKRNGDIDSEPRVHNAMLKELNRRNIKLNITQIVQQKIKLGISTCQLYASWGNPKSENRSVGKWGVHIQHVYGSGVYVYSENGLVTSWQD